MIVRRLDVARPVCHGHGLRWLHRFGTVSIAGGERCPNAALYSVLTDAALHYYCRDCLPRRYRALVGLGTVP